MPGGKLLRCGLIVTGGLHSRQLLPHRFVLADDLHRRQLLSREFVRAHSLRGRNLQFIDRGQLHRGLPVVPGGKLLRCGFIVTGDLHSR